MKPYTIVFITTIILSLFIDAQAQKQEFSFMVEYPAPGVVNFGLSASDGFIHAYPTDGNSIRVYYIVHKGNAFMKMTQEELAEKVEIEIRSTDDRLDIHIKQKEKYNWSGWNNKYNVSCEVYVPENTSCYLKSSDGNIRIRDLSADQKCRTSDGDIWASNIGGALQAITSDGDVTVDQITGNIQLESSDGDLKAETVDGDARLTTSDGDIRLYKVNGIIEASTSDGDIVFTDCAGSFSGNTSDGNVRGNLLKLQGRLSVVTSDGDIDVRIPAGSGIDLKMKGEDLTYPGTQISGKISEHHIQGQVNGGGTPVELISSDGDVNLSYR